VQVVERTPVAAVPVGEQFSLIDAEGVAFRTVAKRPAGLPVAKLAAPGPADVNTRSALVVLSSLTAELREQLVSISVPAPAQVSLGLRRNRTIVWGDDTESEKKAQVATALLGRKGDTIDVSAPTVVTIR
jgi:cell division protein FtsQ